MIGLGARAMPRGRSGCGRSRPGRARGPRGALDALDALGVRPGRGLRGGLPRWWIRGRIPRHGALLQARWRPAWLVGLVAGFHRWSPSLPSTAASIPARSGFPRRPRLIARAGSATRSATSTVSASSWRSRSSSDLDRAEARARRAASRWTGPLPVIAIYLTSSRGAIAAGVVGLITLMALGMHRSRRTLTVVLAGLGCLPLLWLASRFPEMRDGLNRRRQRPGIRHALRPARRRRRDRGLRLLLDGRLATTILPAPAMLRLVGATSSQRSRRSCRWAGRAGRQVHRPGFRPHRERRRIRERLGKRSLPYWRPPGTPSPRSRWWGSAPVTSRSGGGPHASIPVFVQDAHSLVHRDDGRARDRRRCPAAVVPGLGRPRGARRPAVRPGCPRHPARGRGQGPHDGNAAEPVIVGGVAVALDRRCRREPRLGLGDPGSGATGLDRSGPGLLGAPPRLRVKERQSERFGLGLGTIAFGWLAVSVAVIVFIAQTRLGDATEATGAVTSRLVRKPRSTSPRSILGLRRATLSLRQR